MQKINKKKLLTAGGILMAVGAVITGIGFLLGGWAGFSITSSGIHSTRSTTYVQEKKTLSSFHDIDISLCHADINVIPSNEFAIEYHLSGGPTNISYNVQNNKLKLKEKRGISVGAFMSFSSESYVNLYVPKSQYFKTVNLYTESGDITFESLTCENAKFTLEYGSLDGEELSCKEKLDVRSDSGDTEIKNVKTDSLTLQADYGDVTFDKIVCKNGNIALDAGDLELYSADLKNMKLQNEYGDIDLSLLPSLNDYDFDLSTDYGSVDVNGQENTHEDIAEEAYKVNSGKGRSIKAYCDAGDISVD